MAAYGYIRQSRRADLDVALSPEQQRRDVAALAARDGVELVAVIEDLGRSGGKGKERLRAGYQDMLAAIAAGNATTIYTKTLTRLGRSVRELYRVLELAETHGCRIVTAKEGVMDPRTPIGKAQFGMLAVFAEFERDLAVERARDNVATRRARGDRMGRRTYGSAEGEDPAVVVEAFRRAGTYNAAAVALNRVGLPTVLGRKWSPTSVKVLIAREAPELAPVRGRSGSPSAASFVLNGLLRCPCGGTLTGTTSHAGKYVRYHCHRASADPAHPRPSSVAEANVLPWVQAAVTGLRRMPQAVEEDGAEARRATLEAKRVRILDMYADGAIDKADRDRRLEDVAELLDALTVTAQVLSVPSIDWAWPTADVNRLLRLLVDHVELGADLRPGAIGWRGRIAEWAA